MIFIVVPRNEDGGRALRKQSGPIIVAHVPELSIEKVNLTGWLVAWHIVSVIWEFDAQGCQKEIIIRNI